MGFVFGMMTSTSGYSWYYATLSSIFLYAGASQFLLVNSIKSTLPYVDIFVSIFLLNLRHIFYFKPIEKKIETMGFKRWYSVLTLTDEVFAVLSDDQVQRKDAFLVLLFSHIYWVLGTLLGALFGQWLSSARIHGLDFSLIALFVVLFIEKLKPAKDKLALSLCLVVCITAWNIIPMSFFLLSAIIIGLALAVWLERRPYA